MTLTFDLHIDLNLNVTLWMAALLILIISSLVKIGQTVWAQKAKNQYDLWLQGDLDLKVMHNKGHRMSYFVYNVY